MLRNESFASSDSDFEEIEDESTEEMLNESSDSSSEVDIIKEEPLDSEKHEEDFSIDVDESHNDEEEYKKYYQDEVEKRDVTSSTFENESCCEVPDSSTTKPNVLRRAWKRLSLSNHSQPSIDDDVKDIWSKTRSDSKLPRRGSLNHMLYTHWKSSHADSNQTSPLQRKASLHRSRRWSMTSTASTLRTVSTAGSTVSSLSAASSLVAPLGRDLSEREVVTMGPSPSGTTTQSSKNRWWKPTTRRLSLSTTREKSIDSQL